jgi:hypothetical protein
MQPNEWAALVAASVATIIGVATIVSYINRRLISPLKKLIEQELSTNGGSSIKDRVTSIQESTSRNEKAIKQTMELLEEHINWSKLRSDEVDEQIKAVGE